MDSRTANRVGNVVLGLFVAALLWLIWGWWSFTGLYRFIAVLSLRLFGSYGVFSTFLTGFVALALSFFGFAAPLIRRNAPPVTKGLAPTRAQAEATAWRGMGRVMLVAGCIALLLTLGAVAGLIRDSHRNQSVVTLDLASPAPLPPGTDLVHLIGNSRSEWIVSVERKQTPGVDTSSDGYMAVVGPNWQPGQPVPVIVQGSPSAGLDVPTGVLEERGRLLHVKLPVAMVRSTTSGFAEYLLERNGASSDAHTIVLDTDLNGARSQLWSVFAVSLLVAVVLLPLGLFTARVRPQQTNTKATQ